MKDQQAKTKVDNVLDVIDADYESSESMDVQAVVENTVLDTPNDLILTPMEHDIVNRLANGGTPSKISKMLGIPKGAIFSLLSRDGVRDFVTSIVDARNLASQMYLPEIMGRIIDDKMAKAEEEGVRDADLTRKDVVEVAKELSSIIKSQERKQEDVVADRFTTLYQQINVLQGQAEPSQGRAEPSQGRAKP